MKQWQTSREEWYSDQILKTHQEKTMAMQNLESVVCSHPCPWLRLNIGKKTLSEAFYRTRCVIFKYHYKQPKWPDSGMYSSQKKTSRQNINLTEKKKKRYFKEAKLKHWPFLFSSRTGRRQQTRRGEEQGPGDVA